MRTTRLQWIGVAISVALTASGQSTTQFQAVLNGLKEVPPNADPTMTTATLTLEGNSLSFRVDVPAITFTAMSGSLHGPAAPGEVGPLLFDLGGPTFHSGSSQGSPPGYRFFSPFDGVFGAGPFALNDTQIAQLESGSWYMEITSFQMPNSGVIRGQILAVPEPSTMALWGMGITLLMITQAKRKRVL